MLGVSSSVYSFLFSIMTSNSWGYVSSSPCPMSHWSKLILLKKGISETSQPVCWSKASVDQRHEGLPENVITVSKWSLRVRGVLWDWTLNLIYINWDEFSDTKLASKHCFLLWKAPHPLLMKTDNVWFPSQISRHTATLRLISPSTIFRACLTLPSQIAKTKTKTKTPLKPLMAL